MTTLDSQDIGALVERLCLRSEERMKEDRAPTNVDYLEFQAASALEGLQAEEVELSELEKEHVAEGDRPRER